MSGDTFGLHNLGERDATGMSWVGTRDAAKNPTVRGTAPLTPTKSGLASNVYRVEVEEPTSKRTKSIQCKNFYSNIIFLKFIYFFSNLYTQCGA